MMTPDKEDLSRSYVARQASKQNLTVGSHGERLGICGAFGKQALGRLPWRRLNWLLKKLQCASFVSPAKAGSDEK